MKLLKKSVLFTLGLSLSVIGGHPIPVTAQDCDPSIMSCVETPSFSPTFGSDPSSVESSSSIFGPPAPVESSPIHYSTTPTTTSANPDYDACMKEVDASKAKCQHRGMVACGILGGRFGASPLVGGTVGGLCSAVYDGSCNMTSESGAEYCKSKNACIQEGKPASECGSSPYIIGDPWPQH